MKELLLLLTFLPLATGLICPFGYTLINSRICLRYVSTPLPHYVAELVCKGDGGTLVTAKNAIDNRAVASFANAAGATEIWIGLYSYSNSTTQNFWDDYHNNPEGWTNLYNNWVAGYPLVLTGRCSVMEVASSFGANLGKWKSVPCNNQNSPTIQSYPYVCEIPPTYPASPCDVNYNGYCYWRSQNLGTGQKLDITQAAAACAKKGAGVQLVSIHTKMESDFIKNLYYGTPTNLVYIGAKEVSMNNFAWMDDTAWDFNYVDPLDFASKQCLAIDVSNPGNGLWKTTDCTNQLDFLCKQKISPTTVLEKKAVPKQAPIAPPLFTFYSNCNQSALLSPDELSSVPTYNTPNAYCYFGVHALGPYKIGIFFNFWATYGTLDIYDEFENNIAHITGDYNRQPFSILPVSNFARMTFTPARPAATPQIDRGFTAKVLPL